VPQRSATEERRVAKVFRIPCPHCGPRNRSEFRHVGEQTSRPDPRTTTPQEWRDYLYVRNNLADWTMETWYHGAGCRQFMTLRRHTVTNEFRPSAEPVAAADADLTRP